MFLPPHQLQAARHDSAASQVIYGGLDSLFPRFSMDQASVCFTSKSEQLLSLWEGAAMLSICVRTKEKTNRSVSCVRCAREKILENSTPSAEFYLFGFCLDPLVLLCSFTYALLPPPPFPGHPHTQKKNVCRTLNLKAVTGFVLRAQP